MKRSEMSSSMPRQPFTVALNADVSINVVPNTISINSTDFNELDGILEAASDTPNRYRAGTNILRKQCCFLLPHVSGTYNFGQPQDSIRREYEEMPNAVKMALDIVRRDNKQFDYPVIQANMYRHGGVGISPHADNEPFMNPDAPIYSFTFMECPEATPRPFSVYTMDERRILDIPLYHGDMLVMRGKMQTMFLHGIERDRPNKYKKRINLTVRAI